MGEKEQMVRLWLDDLRPMPDGYDVHARTAGEAIAILQAGNVVAISFDNDLGPEEAGQGYQVANWIEEAAFNGSLPKLAWRIHSANPVGRQNIARAMENADRFWSRG